MKLVHVYIEHASMQLNRTFTYDGGDFDVQRGMRAVIPFHHRERIGFIDKVEEIDDQDAAGFPYELKKIIDVIDDRPLIRDELFDLASWMSHNYIAPMISCFQVMLPAKLKPRTTRHTIKREAWVRYVKSVDSLTVKQEEVLQQLQEVQEMLRSEYYANYKSVGKKLIEKGCAEVFTKEASAHMQKRQGTPSAFTLSEEQQNAITRIQDCEGHYVHLLHGATGSGKTEVFLRLAQDVIEQGKQVLILVPEISLTPQMVKRVEDRFGSQVAIYHSALNNQEKYEQFQLVYKQQVKIVVGTRSAVFMPFHDLGLIVMDEEHDTSYKQESAPRYHCRDVAIWRGQYHHCPVVLASATPSLESYARAYKGKYQLVEMPSRINQQFPQVKLVAMRYAVRRGDDYLLSKELMDAVKERIERHEQVILLLNRRGYTPILRCVSCGHVQMCPHCDIAMSYHKEEKILKCHTCGHQEPMPYECPKCGEHTWRYLGAGTQRLEETLHQQLPQARLIRMDADTTSRKYAHQKLLQRFEQHEADILLGTQMIAKGLDFANVTLVGILNGDALLNRSDYRCVEMTFDLLEQACGRSGRGDKKGEVIIQAYDPGHYAIQLAAAHQYRRFFKEEMKYRHIAKYPPYAYLGSLVFIHRDQTVAGKDAHNIAERLKGKADRILGPSELTRIKDEYRYRIILKGKDREALVNLLMETYQYHRSQKLHSRMELDIDPLVLD